MNNPHRRGSETDSKHEIPNRAARVRERFLPFFKEILGRREALSRAPDPSSSWLSLALAAAALTLLSSAAVWYFFSHGYLQWYGDAEAHLNNARRIFDSLTPGYDQLGTPWLPLPHLAIVPFARVDA